MSTHTITVRLTQQAQVAAILTGQDGRAEQTYEVGQEHVQSLLDLRGATVDAAGAASWRPDREDGYHLMLNERPVDGLAACDAVLVAHLLLLEAEQAERASALEAVHKRLREYVAAGAAAAAKAAADWVWMPAIESATDEPLVAQAREVYAEARRLSQAREAEAAAEEERTRLAIRAYARATDHLARAEADGYEVERAAVRHAIEIVRARLVTTGSVIDVDESTLAERSAPRPEALDGRDRVIAALASVERPAWLAVDVGRVSRCERVCTCGEESDGHDEDCTAKRTVVPVTVAAPYAEMIVLGVEVE